MKTPKQRFLETSEAKAFYDLSVNPSFLLAIDYALLEMVSKERSGGQERNAMQNAFRLEGAIDFVHALLDLPIAVERKPVVPLMPANLPEM